MRGNILKDRSGKISGAIAALLAIIVIAIYTKVASTPKGAEDAFFTVYGAFKWFVKALGFEDFFKKYFQGFEEFLKYIQGTFLWPLTISFLALIVMVLAVAGIYYGTVITVGTTTWILGLVSDVRARRQEEREISSKSDKKLAEKTIGAIGKLRKLRISKRIPKDLSGTPGTDGKGGAKTKGEGDLKGLFRTQWWQIRDTFTLVLEKGKLGEYVMKARKLYPTERSPDGSFIELAKAIGMDVSNIHRIVNEGRESITVGNLMRLLYLLDIPYKDVTPYIKSIGGRGDREAIINPKFPIELYNPDGARLLAAALKDGDVNIQYHFEYVNYDKDNLRRVNEAVNRIFGEIEPSILYEKNGKQKGIHYQSALIGDVLEDAGAIVGRKADQDYRLPSLIRFGNREIKNAYFDQVIKDEGSIDRGDYRLTITGAGEIESKITQAHNGLLDQLHFEDGNWPSGAPKRFLIISEKLEKRIPSELRPVYKDLVSKLEDEGVPTILKDERDLLEKIYEVKAAIQLRQIYIGGKVGLRGSWVIVVGGKDNVEKIKDEINSFRKNWGDKER